MGTSATYTMLIILRDKSRGLLVLRKVGYEKNNILSSTWAHARSY